MPRGNVRVSITGDTSGLSRATRSAERDLDRFDRRAHSSSSGLKSLAKSGGLAAAGLGAAGLGAALVSTVSVTVDFEKKLSSLKAITEANSKEMAKFRKQAMQAGLDTAFSAREAATAQIELAKGGLSVAQIMKGGLRSALALAAAGELELGDAATYTVNAMKLFNLRGKDTMKVADALATAANKTTADVSDFGMALMQGGTAAKAAGLSFRETVTALELLAAIGVKNSDAGTSLKTALMQLASPTKKAKEVMHELNLEFFDSHGNIKSLTDISAMLQERFKGLTREQRLNATGLLVGRDGMRTLLALYDAGPEKIKRFEDGLKKQGTAADVAKTKQDNLAGAIEQFKGALETAQITLGTKFLPDLTRATRSMTTFLVEMQKGKGQGGEFADTVVEIWSAFRVLAKVVGGINSVFSTFGDMVRKTIKAVARLLTDVWRQPAKAAGDFFASMFRGFAKVFDLASKIPGAVGDHFDDLQSDAERAAKSVDKLGEEIGGLKSKTIKITVETAMQEFMSGEFKPLVRDPSKQKDGWGIQAKADKAATAWGKKQGPFGGPLGSGPLMGGGGGDLHGANANLGPFAAIGNRMGLHITAGKDDHSKYTSTGNLSMHGYGRAIDMADGAPAMLAFARAMAANFGGRLAELIHTPLGFSIKNGQRVAPYATAEHYNHVHVAMARGGRTQQKVRALVGEEGPEIVDLPAGAFVHTAKKTRGMLGGAIAAFAGGGEVLPRSVYAAINRAMTPEFNTWSKHTYHMTGKRLLAKVAAVEGGGSIDEHTSNTSSAGARGPFQFIASTRAAYMAKYHIDAWKNDYSAARAAMIHLRGTGVAGYNPGLAAYQGMVLGANVNTGPLRTGKIGNHGLSRSERRERTPVKGRSITDETILAGEDVRHENRWSRVQGIRDDGKVTPRERKRADRAYTKRAAALNTRIKIMRNRLKKINRALKGKLTPGTRQRLLQEKAQLIRDIGGTVSELKGLTTEFQDLVAPFDNDAFAGVNKEAALAALTPGTADDVAAATSRVGIAELGLGMAQLSGASDEVITQWATDLKSARDALEGLTGATEEANRINQQLIDLQTQANVIETEKLALLKSQGPALLLALSGVTNGWIGGNAGLGRSFPSYTGLGGLARA